MLVDNIGTRGHEVPASWRASHRPDKPPARERLRAAGAVFSFHFSPLSAASLEQRRGIRGSASGSPETYLFRTRLPLSPDRKTGFGWVRPIVGIRATLLSRFNRAFFRGGFFFRPPLSGNSNLL